MGGAAFAHSAAHGQPTLRTPRMSPETYERLKLIHRQRLQASCPGCEVSCLREAPEKADYGDIDFMVASDRPCDAMRLADSLGAAGVLSYGGLCMLAVPTDGEKHIGPPVRYTNLNSNNGTELSTELSKEAYAQIDVDFVKPELFAWHAFHASYGDLSSLLGQIVHNLGFTVSDKGMTLRLKELDDAKESVIPLRVVDKQGQLFLSNEPNLVMQFLGLDTAVYHKGFDTVSNFYAWLAKCRLLTADYVGNLQYRRKENSNQRQKEHKRPMIANFFKEYLPAHMDRETSDVGDPETWKAKLAQRRQEWHNEAVTFFGKGQDLEKLRDDLVKSIANQTAEHLIKPMVFAHYGGGKDKVHEIIRALRRWVGFENGQPKVLLERHSDEESQLRFWLNDDISLWEPAVVDDWIRLNWAQCRSLERERSNHR